MSPSSNGRKMVNIISTIGVPAALIAGLAFSARFEYSPRLRWGILILVGEFALLLMGFKWPEIVNAFHQARGRPLSAGASERSTYFWEAAARNAVYLGVLGTLAGFVIQFCSSVGGPVGFTFALGNALISTVYGLILAAILSTPAIRTRWVNETAHPVETAAPSDASPAMRESTGFRGHASGHILFLALILWILFPPVPGGSTRPFDWFVHWPAWLAVFGGALALGTMWGTAFKTGSLALGLACAGLIASLLGVVQALQGFSQASIAAVSEGITFMISSCFAALVGLLAIGLPLQDRNQDRRGNGLIRLVWFGFPVLTLLLIALATLMVMIPIRIEKP